MAEITQNTTYSRAFYVVQSADHLTGATGASLTVTISKAGAAFAAPAGVVSEMGSGWYRIVLTTVDTDTAGDLAYHVTGTGCDPTDFADQIVLAGTNAASLTFTGQAVAICNAALVMNGGQTINALDDSSDRARQCAALYPFVREYAISAHPWHCCIARATINPDVATPEFDWTYQYTLPVDFIRLLQVGELGYEDEYRIEGGKILSDADSLKIRYVSLNEIESSWTPLLRQAVMQGMRAALSYAQTQSASLEELVERAIAPIVSRARAIDGADQPPETLGDFRLLSSRFGFGRF